MAAPSRIAELVDLDSLSESMSDAVEQAVRRGQRIVLTRHGAPVAAIVSAQEIETIDRLLWGAAFEAFAKISDAFRDVPLEELEREIERATAEVREETREEQRSRQGS